MQQQDLAYISFTNKKRIRLFKIIHIGSFFWFLFLLLLPFYFIFFVIISFLTPIILSVTFVAFDEVFFVCFADHWLIVVVPTPALHLATAYHIATFVSICFTRINL